MPPTHTDEGMRAAVEVRSADPDAKVLVLSQYVVLAYADELLAGGEGGVGYLLKDRVSRIDQFLGAVEQVAAGGTSLDPEVVAQLFGRRRVTAHPVDSLTPREQEVLALMAQGRTNAAIAESSSSPRERSRNTPSASSPSSASPRPTSTAGSRPSSPGCAAHRSPDKGRRPTRPPLRRAAARWRGRSSLPPATSRGRACSGRR